MWVFKGEYTGEARAYITEKLKKEAKLLLIIGLVISVLSTVLMGVLFGMFKDASGVVILCTGVLVTFILIAMISRAREKMMPKCLLKIENDGISVFEGGRWNSLAFYKIQEIIFLDDGDSIAIENEKRMKVALQKELLVEGDWEELKTVLRKIEESLNTDEPIYQLEEPSGEYYEATVIYKRIYERFISKVSAKAPVGEFVYFVTFRLDSGEEIELAVGQANYEKIQTEQTGTLVLMNGNFFAFDSEEDAE